MVISLLVQCDLSEVYNISNGKLDNRKTIYEYADTVDYSCDEGYENMTARSLQCLSDKSWSPSPRCEQGLFDSFSRWKNALHIPSFYFLSHNTSFKQCLHL